MPTTLLFPTPDAATLAAACENPAFRLTPREKEIVLLLALGAATRDIGDHLGISPHTAKRHTEAVFRKLGVLRRREVRPRLLGAPETRPRPVLWSRHAA